MSLFDFFKKPDKKKQQNAAQQPAADNPFSSPEQNKKRYEAAMDFLQFFQEKTPLLNGRRVWPGQACSGLSIKKMLNLAWSFYRKK